MGSIPALAGERAVMLKVMVTTGVYPRACGGTYHPHPPHPPQPGLSPRLRGNVALPGGRAQGIGSIPALAGERHYCSSHRHCCRVYPRACGGTVRRVGRSLFQEGLSPRLRGNADRDLDCISSCGSIPALAGERVFSEITQSGSGVYPRACGGTVYRDRWPERGLGLSPRLRGNGSQPESPPVSPGSIPALAGERFMSRWSSALKRVYPRACGGTCRLVRQTTAAKGLSARLRGNAYHDTIEKNC